jgi:hypothetical protein
MTDLILAGFGLGLLAWCGLVLVVATRSGRRRDDELLAEPLANMEARLRDLAARRRRAHQDPQPPGG